jgi:CRISPR-associated protein Cmr3
MGEDIWAEGLFPPPPSVFLGALRTAVLALQSEALSHLQSDDPTGNMQITDINIAQNDPHAFRFICPSDLVKKKSANKFSLLKLEKTSWLSSNYMERLLVNKEGYEVENCPPDHWLDNSSFAEYLKGVMPGDPTIFKIIAEPKIGIGRDRGLNAASEGMLYRVGMQRLADDYGNQLLFSIKINGLPESIRHSLSSNGLSFVKLGAESKAVWGELQEPFTPPDIMPTFDSRDRYFKLVFTTPAIFCHPAQKRNPAHRYGWIPSFIDPETWEGKWQGMPVKLISAAVGKPQSIGGFDMLKKEPKPMLKVVPAGSVYFFRLLDEADDISKYANGLQGPISLTDDKAHEGFGLAYLGRVVHQFA